MMACENEFEGMDWVKASDDAGFFFVAYLPYMAISGGQFFGSVDMDVSATLERYLDKTIISRYWNHPSVIAWGGSAGSCNGGEEVWYSYHPRYWGMFPLDSEEAVRCASADGFDVSGGAGDRLRACREYAAMVKRLDSTRPHLSHFDDGETDGWGTFCYYNWQPMQEWEESVYNYRTHGVKPIGDWEHGNPYPGSFLSHAVPDGNAEPWMTEFSAIWLGPRVYAQETFDYREGIRKSWNPQSGSYAGGAHGNPSLPAKAQSCVQSLWAMFNRRLYRSWRLVGVNMGIEPFGPADQIFNRSVLEKDNGKPTMNPEQNLKTPGIKAERYRTHGKWPSASGPSRSLVATGTKPDGLTPFGEMLYENNRDFLAFVADHEPNPLAKTHIYASGERVHKQICIAYDGFKPLSFTLDVRVVCAGDEVLDCVYHRAYLGPKTELIPCEFAIPMSVSGSLATPSRGRIDLVAKTETGAVLMRDSFAYEVVSRPRRANVPSSLTVLRGEAFSLEAVRALPFGRPILAMGLSIAQLEHMGLKAFPARLREFWADSSLGVCDDLLHDWRGGRPHRLEEKSAYRPARRGYNPSTGTTGMLAENVVEVPCCGNFTPLLHGGFDLSQTALLEMEIEGHPVTLCQLEFDLHREDPAACALQELVMKRAASRSLSLNPGAVWGG